MIIVKTREEIELMRESALVVSKTLGMLAKEVKAGVTTQQLDTLAEDFIRSQGAIPGFLGLYDCPSTLLCSVNDAVVHGLPTNIPLKEGDIVSIDCGALMNDFYGDHAYTFEIGEVAPETKKLIEVTKESLYVGIRELKLGNRVGDVGYAIQQHCEAHGYGVVRELVGHGLGRKMHEDPEMPNYGKRGRGKKFIEGMVVAIEPMINGGTHRVKQLKDGWTIVTLDGKPSVHFEHDVAIVDGGKAIIALPSVTSKGISRIVPSLKPGAGVVTTRSHVHYVVTEYGVANLYGKTIKQRVKALTEIAHPDFRDSIERDYFNLIRS